MTGGEAGVERGGRPTIIERTNHTDPVTPTGGTVGIGAATETDQGVEVETESWTGCEIGVKTVIGTEVKKETKDGKIQILVEKRGTSQEAQAERGKEKSIAEKEAPRTTINMRKPLTIPKHSGITNGPKRARKRTRSIKRKAICRKG